jgi:hypothetical protein
MRYDEPSCDMFVGLFRHVCRSLLTCAMRYDEPRLVWTSLPTTH